MDQPQVLWVQVVWVRVVWVRVCDPDRPSEARLPTQRPAATHRQNPRFQTRPSPHPPLPPRDT